MRMTLVNLCFITLINTLLASNSWENVSLLTPSIKTIKQDSLQPISRSLSRSRHSSKCIPMALLLSVGCCSGLINAHLAYPDPEIHDKFKIIQELLILDKVACIEFIRETVYNHPEDHLFHQIFKNRTNQNSIIFINIIDTVTNTVTDDRFKGFIIVSDDSASYLVRYPFPNLLNCKIEETFIIHSINNSHAQKMELLATKVTKRDIFVREWTPINRQITENSVDSQNSMNPELIEILVQRVNETDGEC
eukprot:515183_1